MSGKSIKAVVFGVGSTGSLAVRYMIEKGVDIVGAVGHVNNIGKDIGEIAGIGEYGVILETDGKAVLERTEPDIAVICIDTQTAYPLIKMCLEHKVNVATIAIELFYLDRTDPAMARELDLLAKKNGVTLYGGGIQDINWQNLCAALSGSVHNITKITGENWALVDDQGLQVVTECYAGMTLEQFKAENEGVEPEATAFTQTMYAIADEMDLHVTSEYVERKPCIAQSDLYVEKADVHIKKGDLSGFYDTATLETEEGITLVCTFVEKVTEGEETAINAWHIEGEPNFDTVTTDMHGEVTTSIGIVNRIADVIKAPAGYVLCKDMPRATYHSRPLPEYLDGPCCSGDQK